VEDREIVEVFVAGAEVETDVQLARLDRDVFQR
jgi:hypothetical protein